MLENRATVVQIQDHTAWVLTNQVSGCEQCNGQGCGSSKVAQLFCSQPKKFEVENSIGAAVGDEVIVSVADGAVLRGIGLLYVLPLILMVLGGGLASMMSNQSVPSDAYVATGGVAGLMLGFVVAKWVSARQARLINRPFIARRWTDQA
jgi:sigma-E factor negative regulatory protein RseC